VKIEINNKFHWSFSQHQQEATYCCLCVKCDQAKNSFIPAGGTPTKNNHLVKSVPPCASTENARHCGSCWGIVDVREGIHVHFVVYKFIKAYTAKRNKNYHFTMSV